MIHFYAFSKYSIDSDCNLYVGLIEIILIVIIDFIKSSYVLNIMLFNLCNFRTYWEGSHGNWLLAFMKNIKYYLIVILLLIMNHETFSPLASDCILEIF